MTKREIVADELLDGVVGGNITYTWMNGQGRCGLGGNNKFTFTDKGRFESFMTDCMVNKGMNDVQTLQALYSAGIIRK